MEYSLYRLKKNGVKISELQRVEDIGIHDDVENMLIVPPIDYVELLTIISASRLIITDSGGIQEEAPSFNTPVLVLRDKTERPESIKMGVGVLVGADKSKIIENFRRFYDSDISAQGNPYGDGKASVRVVDKLVTYLG